MACKAKNIDSVVFEGRAYRPLIRGSCLGEEEKHSFSLMRKNNQGNNILIQQIRNNTVTTEV